MMDKYREMALDILEEVCETDEVREDETLDLFEAGLLDSLAIVSVLMGIEEKCGLRLQPTEISKENISSVVHLAEFLKGKVSTVL